MSRCWIWNLSTSRSSWWI